jgi:hypothetical protein
MNLFSTINLQKLHQNQHENSITTPNFPLHLQNTVDKLVQRANASILIGTSSWKEQFVEALTVNPGERAEIQF